MPIEQLGISTGWKFFFWIMTVMFISGLSVMVTVAVMKAKGMNALRIFDINTLKHTGKVVIRWIKRHYTDGTWYVDSQEEGYKIVTEKTGFFKRNKLMDISDDFLIFDNKTGVFGANHLRKLLNIDTNKWKGKCYDMENKYIGKLAENKELSKDKKALQKENNELVKETNKVVHKQFPSKPGGR